jgi:hypothetical protein
LTPSKYGGKCKMDARNMLHFQCVCGEVVQAARWRNFSLMGQRYMGTVVEVPRWGLAGLLICPRQKGVAVSETLFQAWKAWRRQKDFANLYKEMRELSQRKCESGVPWWPAISVGMTDKSGQVLLPARTCCQLNHTSHKASMVKRVVVVLLCSMVRGDILFLLAVLCLTGVDPLACAAGGRVVLAS